MRNEGKAKESTVAIKGWPSIVLKWCTRSTAIFVLLLFFLMLLLSSLARTHFALSGDAAFNFSCHHILTGEYWSQNFNALFNPGDDLAGSKHIGMKIESGFPLLLYFSSFFGEIAPFFVNSLIWPLLFISYIFLISASLKNKSTGIITGLFAVFLILVNTGARSNFSALVSPFRDTSSHFFGILALLILILNCKRERPGWIWTLVGGLLIGLSGFCRITGYLFIVPAAVIIVLNSKVLLKQRVKQLLFLSLGFSFGIGLLVAQNIFEGKSIINLPQGEKLFLTEKQSQRNQSIKVGIDPGNIKVILPRVLTNVVRNVSPFLRFLGYCGLLYSIAFKKRLRCPSLPFIAGFLVFSLFYGCYDKVVTRYNLITVLFFIASISIGIQTLATEVIAGLLRLRFRVYRPPLELRTLKYLLFYSLIIVNTYFISGYIPLWRQARSEWRDVLAFKHWIQSELPESSKVLIRIPEYEIWYNHFVGNSNPWDDVILPWNSDFSPTDDNYYFMVPILSKGLQLGTGWVWDFFNTKFDLIPVENPLWLNSASIRFAGVHMFKINGEPKCSHSFFVRRQAERPDNLFINVADSREIDGVLKASLDSPEWGSPWSVELREGENILKIPDYINAFPASLTMTSSTPIPKPFESYWVSGHEITVSFREYNSIGKRYNSLENCTLAAVGYQNWGRDYGSLGVAKYQSSPVPIMKSDTTVSLPVFWGYDRGEVIARFFGTMGVGKREELSKIEEISILVDNERIPGRFFKANGAYANGKFRYLRDFVFEFPMPLEARDRPSNLKVEKIVSSDQGPVDAEVFLHRLSYEIKKGDMVEDFDLATIGWKFPISWRPRSGIRWLFDPEEVNFPGLNLKESIESLRHSLPENAHLLRLNLMPPFGRILVGRFSC